MLMLKIFQSFTPSNAGGMGGWVDLIYTDDDLVDMTAESLIAHEHPCNKWVFRAKTEAMGVWRTHLYHKSVFEVHVYSLAIKTFLCSSCCLYGSFWKSNFPLSHIVEGPSCLKGLSYWHCSSYILLWVELDPPKRYVEDLTLIISEGSLIWKQCHYRCN